MMSPGTRICALVTGMPTLRPARCAAASAASTTRRLPSRPTRTSGVSAGGAAPPDCLLTRSVDQVGRKSETTLRIASLHFETGAFAAAAADEFEPPAGAPYARNRQRMRRQRADAPARHGSGRLPVHFIFGVMPREIGCFRFRSLNSCRSRPGPTSVESGRSSNPRIRIFNELPGVTGSPAFAGDDTIERTKCRKRNVSYDPPSHVGEAANGDADGAGAFCGKLKPAGGCHGKPRNFGDHGAKSTAIKSPMRSAISQSFL